jgi:uncharacterized protein
VTPANLASLDALNPLIAESGSLEGPLPMTRFQPNIVLGAAAPWVEDGWTGGRIRVGDVTFRVPVECGRCVVTTPTSRPASGGASRCGRWLAIATSVSGYFAPPT